MPVIWIPDGEPFEVEWYPDEDGRALGVQRMSEHFMAHRVDDKPRTGFQPPRAPVAYFQGAPVPVRYRRNTRG